MKSNKSIDVWKFIDVRGKGECWPWTGRTTHPRKGQGYGYFSMGRRSSYVAHRIVYLLEHPGQISLRAPRDKTLREFVLHKCDNRICCNPSHLFLGNYDDNNKDAKRKGRAKGAGPKGVAHKLAKLTMEQAREIRWISSLGVSNERIRKDYGISNEAVRRVVNGASYRE